MRSKHHVFAATLLCLVTSSTLALDSLAPAQAIEHVGEHATVCGVVASATHASSTRGSPTFLNLDEPYPDHVFTAIIWGSDRPQFDPPPEALRGRQVCVTGTIEEYRGKAAVKVAQPSQLVAN